MCIRQTKLIRNRGFTIAALAIMAAVPPTHAGSPPSIRPAIVTLNLKNVSPLRAITVLTDQVNITLYRSRLGFFKSVPVKRISLALHKVPFWNAMLDFTRKTGISLYDPYAAEDMGLRGVTLSLHHGVLLPALPHFVHGAFLVEMLRCRRPDIRGTAAAKPRATLTMALLLQPPYILWHLPRHWVKIDKLVDSRRHWLIPTKRTWKTKPYVYGPSHRWCVKFGIPLAHRANARTHIHEFNGRIRADVRVAQKTLTFQPNQRRPAEATINHVHIRLYESSWQAKGYRFIVDAELSPKWTSLSSKAVIKAVQRMDFAMYVYDAKGREFPFGGGHSGILGWMGVTTDYEYIDYLRGKNGKPMVQDQPVKATLRLPSSVVRVVVPFNFRNVRLAALSK